MLEIMTKEQFEDLVYHYGEIYRFDEDEDPFEDLSINDFQKQTVHETWEYINAVESGYWGAERMDEFISDYYKIFLEDKKLGNIDPNE